MLFECAKQEVHEMPYLLHIWAYIWKIETYTSSEMNNQTAIDYATGLMLHSYPNYEFPIEDQMKQQYSLEGLW